MLVLQDILPQPMSTVQGLFGFLLGTTRPSNADTVVSVKHTVLAVSWLAINQSVRRLNTMALSCRSRHILVLIADSRRG